MGRGRFKRGEEDLCRQLELQGNAIGYIMGFRKIKVKLNSEL